MKWFFGVLLLLLAALVLESGLLAYATYILLGLLLITRVLSRTWMNGLSARRECKRLTAEVGEEVEVSLSIKNDGFLPVPWVLLEDVLPRVALDVRWPRLKVVGKRLQVIRLRSHGQRVVRYRLHCLKRGYYQIGPVVLETGDLFGLHRRFRVETQPNFVLVYPQMVSLEGYELASRRPIGDVRISLRLYEDPTRIAGVRPYERGDPLNRVHWRATARTGALHSKVYEPSTLAGATILLDFHQAGYQRRGEPFRSELAITTAASLANAVYELGQQVGLVTNGRDAVDRIRLEGWEHEQLTRTAARKAAAMRDASERLQPIIVETRRGADQLLRIRETLARVELTDGMPFGRLVTETAGRLPRDATVVAVLPAVSVESALALGNLRRRGLAVTAVLVALDGDQLEKGHGRLLAEGIRDVRHLRDEVSLVTMCQRQMVGIIELDASGRPTENPDLQTQWMQGTPYNFGDTDLARDV
jgi:uncharacterized protein (DUF58 family)